MDDEIALSHNDEPVCPYCRAEFKNNGEPPELREMKWETSGCNTYNKYYHIDGAAGQGFDVCFMTGNQAFWGMRDIEMLSRAKSAAQKHRDEFYKWVWGQRKR